MGVVAARLRVAGRTDSWGEDEVETSMTVVVISTLLLLAVPYWLSRGFPAIFRWAVVTIVVVRATVMFAWHFSLMRDTGRPIILDSSVDEKKYYDFGEAFANADLRQVSFDDLAEERGAEKHLGYFVVNLAAFHICPDHPMLFLRLFKLLMFHVGLGVLATTWRINGTATRAAIAYVVLGLLSIDLFYYNFRNLKDDLILSMFMMIVAVAERTFGSAAAERGGVGFHKMVGAWVVIALLAWAISTMRFYLPLILVAAFGMHVVTGRGMKVIYRVLFLGAIAGGFALLRGMAGWELVEERGGASAVSGAAGNLYAIFKVLVTPLPWQVGFWIFGISQTLYLFLLPVVIWAFIVRFRSNLDWKLYVVVLVAVIVGGKMEDFEPRKRQVMYPIFASWVVMAGRRRMSAAETSSERFDIDAYFADSRNVYA